jgi:DNA-binding CsgD family transcriptional regulator
MRFRVMPRHPSALTAREAQIVRSLLEGRSTREIAVSYGIGHQTVKNYVTVIYEKLGIRARSELPQVCVTAPDVAAGI